MSTRSLLSASYRDLRGRAWAVVLMLSGVALGVAVVVAIDLANTSASKAFTLSTESVVGRATHRIVGGPSGLDSALYLELQQQPTGAELAPVVEDFVTVPALEQRVIRMLGVDPLQEPPFRDFLTPSSADRGSLEPFYTESGTVVLSRVLADELNVELGDSFGVVSGGSDQTLSVLGIVEADEDEFPADLLLTDISSAQELTETEGRLTRIDVIADEEGLGRLKERLPRGITLSAASEQAQTAAQLSEAFRLNLTALSLLALVVGMFLIYNTVMFSAVQRRLVLATLRALGATATQVFCQIVLEALVVGFLGSLAGVALGWFLGQGAVRLVTQTINDFYFVVSVRQAPLEAATVAKAITLGLGSSLIAAIGPALEAARVPPVEAMRRSSLERRVRDWIPIANLMAVVLSLVGLLLLLAFPESLPASFAGMFAVLLGLALFSPMVATWSLPRLGSGLRCLFGVKGGLAARTVVRAISRTSVAIAALMVALSVTIGVGIMIDSFRTTVENWLDLTLRADVYVSAPSPGSTRPSADLDPSLRDRLARVRGVSEVETFRAVTVESEFGLTQLSVADASRQRDARLYRFAQGTPAEVWRRVKDGAVIVSESYSYRHGGLGPGSVIELNTSKGPQSFPIVGVYYDYASDQGTVLMADQVYRQHWDDKAISSLALYLAPESDVGLVIDEVRESLSGSGLLVQANGAIRAQALEVFDRTFAITAALRLLAVVVAFIGVLSAILALQLERRREMATLKALGLTQRGLWTLTTLESGLMGAVAGLLSLPTGLILALVLIYVINLRSFGWTIQLTPNPWLFLQAFIISIAAATLAGVYPMLRLERDELVAALRAE